jgi:F-box protein 9
METSNSALEQFRQQWKEEVSARARGNRKSPSKNIEAIENGGSKPSMESEPSTALPESRPTAGGGRGAERSSRLGIDMESLSNLGLGQLTLGDGNHDEFSALTSPEPESALEYYERAVEKESQGNLRDSLSHYRKAYRMDDCVDQAYKQKHFPPLSIPENPNPSGASVTVASTAHHSSKDLAVPTSVSSFVLGFASAVITGSPPIIEGDEPPRCPIAGLPSEILFSILLSTAISDPAAFSRLALVCRKLAYHVFVENQIWRRVALGPEFGIAGQVYDFQTDLRGNPVTHRVLEPNLQKPAIEQNICEGSNDENWREIFHSYPRIRFTGLYISTANYVRAGSASVTQVSWNSPVHIVTYYRYLRFFRDGTVISLLSVHEPIDVVHHLTRENLPLSGRKDHTTQNATSLANGATASQGSVQAPTVHQVLKHALRGRWRLCQPSAATEYATEHLPKPIVGLDRDLLIETEGVGPQYQYTMHLALSSSSRSPHGVKNNKLQWKGFWSYNQLTDDWAPFRLKNDRAFFFSRVKRYGLGS